MPSPTFLAALSVATAALGAAACGPAEARNDDTAEVTPAELPAADLTSGTQRLATGVQLRYAVQGDPEGTPVILLHGYSDSWFSFTPILPLLPAEHRVYALDQRGHGGSDKPESGYHLADLAADVLAFMDSKRISRAVVVGHSMGSLVAQYVGRAAPDRVAGLVLIGSAPSIHSMPGAGEFADGVRSFRDSVPLEFIREFQASTIYRPLPDGFVERVVEESRRLPPHVWRGIIDGMMASQPVTRSLDARIPTLILWGDRDAVFPRAAQDSLLAAKPAAELKVHAETGHAVHWEQPDAVARELATFFERVSGADSAGS